MPRACRSCTWGMYCTRFHARSSVRTNTTLGGAAPAAGVRPPPPARARAPPPREALRTIGPRNPSAPGEVARRVVSASARRHSSASSSGHLALDHLAAGGDQVEPRGPVELGKLLPLSRPRRPLHDERVAAHGGRVEVARERPGDHALAARLAHLAERERLAVGGLEPVSSSNSRRAAASASSSSPYSPLGIDHARSSLRAQNGPPMCPSSTSGSPSRTR
jgi:hypothetical protein